MVKQKPKQKSKFNKKEFSKILVICNFVFFVVMMVSIFVAWLIKGDTPSEIITSITTCSGIVSGSYLLKSGYENGKKIDGSVTTDSSNNADSENVE